MTLAPEGEVNVNKLIKHHKFLPPPGEPWGRCIVADPGAFYCGLAQAAHAGTEAFYGSSAPYVCPDCVQTGVRPCPHTGIS